MVAGARRTLLGAAVLVGAVVLGGCVADEGEAEPSAPVRSEAGLTDEELQAEAREASAQFVVLIDIAFSTLHVPDELHSLTTAEIAANVGADVERFAASGFMQRGTSSLDNLQPSPSSARIPGTHRWLSSGAWIHRRPRSSIGMATSCRVKGSFVDRSTSSSSGKTQR